MFRKRWMVFLGTCLAVLRLSGGAPVSVRVGKAVVTPLQVASFDMETSRLKGIDADTLAALVGGRKAVPTPCNAFLVRFGGQTVLVDAGTPGQEGEPPVLARLREAGVKPEQVDTILVTHGHFDHIGGLLGKDGRPAFPRAVVRLSQAEADSVQPAQVEQATEALRPSLRQAQAVLKTLQEAGLLKPFAPGEAPLEGVTAIPIPGHTPGQVAYVFGSGKKAFWAVGDVAHFSLVQFSHPEATVFFDRDGEESKASRLATWKRVAREQVVVGGAHLAPALGRVRAEAGAYRWEPVR